MDRRLVELGIASCVAQSVLIREGMSALAGSELSWGLVLFSWLVGMALGARLGAKGWGRWAVKLSPAVALSAASLAGVGVLRFLKPLVVGSHYGGLEALLFWVLAALPAAFLGGVAFPALVEEALVTPGKGYVLEAVGFLVGGVAFTFLLAPAGSFRALALLLGLGGVVEGVDRKVVAGCVTCAALIFVGDPWLEAASWNVKNLPGKLEAWKETRAQRLELVRTDLLNLYSDGHLLGSYPDSWRVGIRTHLVMLLHPRPKKVLVVGGAADGPWRWIKLHRPKKLVVVDEDPGLLELVAKKYGDSEGVEFWSGPLMRIPEVDGGWDLILVGTGVPYQLRSCTPLTLSFFRRLAERLNKKGRLVVMTGVAPDYLGGAAVKLLAAVWRTGRFVFPYAWYVPSDPVMLVFSARSLADLGKPALLEKRWELRFVKDRSFQPAAVNYLLDPLKARRAVRRLERVRRKGELSTRRMPSVLLPAMAFREGEAGLSKAARALLEGAGKLRSMWFWLILLPSIVLGLVAAAAPGRLGELVAALMGFSTMSLFITLISCWQLERGSVFSEIGLLSALFMAGAVGGAALGSRWPTPRTALLAGLGLMLALVATAAAVHGVLLAVPLLLVAGGGFGGALFGPSARLVGGVRRSAAGRSFSSDELGAAVGALLSVVMIPVFGTTSPALFACALLVMLLPALVALALA